MPSLVVSGSTEGGIRVLALEGELDVSTVRSLQARLLASVAEHECTVLDCMRLTFIDSTGMRLLLSAVRLVARRGGALFVACANPTVLRLFALTGMDETFDPRPSREEALAAAAASLAAG